MNLYEERIGWHAVFKMNFVPLLYAKYRGLNDSTDLVQVCKYIDGGNEPLSKSFQEYKKNRKSETYRASRITEQLYEYALWKREYIYD